MLDNSRKAYVYRFIDKNSQTLYVGKTVDLDKRMSEHWSKNSHLKKQGRGDVYEKVQRIEYIKYRTELEALQKELEYINYYKPRYNKSSKIKQIIDILTDINKWKVYRVLKEVPEQDARLQERRRKLLPIAMLFLFVSIIITFIK